MMHEPAWRRYERFHRRDIERDVDEELVSHYEMLIDDFVARGFTHEDAAAAAREALAGIDAAAEECRALTEERADRADRREFWANALNDCKTALRLALTQRRTTVAMIGSAAAALLAAAVVFCAADRMFLQRPPFLAEFARTHRVYVYGRSFFDDDRFLPSVGYHEFAGARTKTTVFDAVVATHEIEVLAGASTSTLRWAQTTLASAQYWSLFRARPTLGRFYSENEEMSAVAVISNRVWQTQFGGDPAAIGREVRIGAGSYRVIGVMPRGFVGLHGPPADYVVPLNAGIRAMAARAIGADAIEGRWLSLIVRRKPGVSATAATAQLTRALAHAETSLETSPTKRAMLGPIQLARGPTPSNAARIARWMSLLAALLLFSAVFNLAGLQTTRIARRRRELAIRTALGMTRRRLASMMIIDTVLQLCAASVIALAIAAAFGATTARIAFPDLPSFRTDEPFRIAAFIVTAALLIGAAAGGGAARYATSNNTVEGLHDAPRSSRRGFTLRGVGMTLQSGAAFLLVVCATLFLVSLREATTVHLGYDATRLVWVTAQPRHGASRDELRAELARLRDALAADSNVERVTFADRAPHMAYVRTNVFTDSLEIPSSMELGYHRVGPEYFATMGIPIREGRALDTTASGASEIVISERIAKWLAPDGTALGKCLRLERRSAPCRTIVGVAKDVHEMQLDGAAGASYYVLSSPEESWQSGLIVRARAPDRVAATQVAAARLSTTSFAIESYAVSTLVAEERRNWQAGAVVLSLLAGAAILLSVVGLSSAVSEDSVRRLHEFAIRSAVGAGPLELASLVVREGALAAAKTIATGAPAAAWMIVRVRPLLFGETPTLALPFVAGLLVGLVVIVATALPALHLRQVDAAEVLRAAV